MLSGFESCKSNFLRAGSEGSGVQNIYDANLINSNVSNREKITGDKYQTFEPPAPFAPVKRKRMYLLQDKGNQQQLLESIFVDLVVRISSK